MVKHTKDILADELLKAGLIDMAVKARNGYYHDYLSSIPFPDLQLANDLEAAGTKEALSLRQRHFNGEFDATKEESDHWYHGPEGQAAIQRLTGKGN